MEISDKLYKELVCECYQTIYSTIDDLIPDIERDRIRGLLEQCSLEQLRTLAKKVKRGDKFELLNSNPVDFLAVRQDGLFIGIEPDGYAHT
jgi:hypothetical protein